MAQQINWTQIDTANVPLGYNIDLGTLENELNAVYAKNLFISGQTLEDFITSGNSIEPLNQYTASLKEAISVSGSSLTVLGDLTVLGTLTSIESNVVSIGDNIIELNGTNQAFGGLLIKDPTDPNQISGSLLWDTTTDTWIAGPVGYEQPIVLEQQLTSTSSSFSNTIDDIAIFRQTGSFYAASQDLQMTGSVRIKGDLIVEGTTTLIQPNDVNLESLIVSGAMSIVQNKIGNQIRSASLAIQNLGSWGDRNNNSVIDCGDGFF